jgi:hypothetical protein
MSEKIIWTNGDWTIVKDWKEVKIIGPDDSELVLSIAEFIDQIGEIRSNK